jgi:hypothetical protein
MKVITDTRRGAKLDIDLFILMYQLFDKTNLRIPIVDIFNNISD